MLIILYNSKKKSEKFYTVPYFCLVYTLTSSPLGLSGKLTAIGIVVVGGSVGGVVGAAVVSGIFSHVTLNVVAASLPSKKEDGKS